MRTVGFLISRWWGPEAAEAAADAVEKRIVTG
jgi:hypothetical protein